MLWKRLKADDFSEVYLFFDYDAHQTNLGSVYENEDVVGQMLESFDNETENGKLYISYPMVEALRDFTIDTWKEIIDVFAMKISCMLGQAEVVSYEQYLAMISPNDIYIVEKNNK